MIPRTRNCYQEGSLAKVHRAKGPDVWVYRWRERQADGHLVQRKKVVGDVKGLKTLTEARSAVKNLRPKSMPSKSTSVR